MSKPVGTHGGMKTLSTVIAGGFTFIICLSFLPLFKTRWQQSDAFSQAGGEAVLAGSGVQAEEPAALNGSCSSEWRTALRQTLSSCWARSERSCFHHAPGDAPSQALLDKLQAHEIQHQRCVAGVQDWRPLLEGVAPPPDPTCRYFLIRPNSNGVGNRLVSIIASFAYALVTDRVLLIQDPGIAAMLCDPFPASSWLIPEEAAALAGYMEQGGGGMSQLLEAAKSVNQSGEGAASGLPQSVWLDLSFHAVPGEQSFYCEEGQQALRSVRLVHVFSEQYFVPGLYLLPSLQAGLDRLFPDRAPFTPLARYLLNPKNALWEQLTQLHDRDFGHPGTMIGLQVRTVIDVEDTYAVPRMLECLTNISQVLAPPADAGRSQDALQGGPAEGGGGARLLVASLMPHHAAGLQRAYQAGAARDGTQVRVLSFSAKRGEVHDQESDEQAFLEMYALSFSDVLFTSFDSTFGYIAAGLAGRRPYLLNIRGQVVREEPFYLENRKPACVLANSSQPCFHTPPAERMCGASMDAPPYVQACVDFIGGVQALPVGS